MPIEAGHSIDATYVMTVCTDVPKHQHSLLKGNRASLAWQVHKLQRQLQQTAQNIQNHSKSNVANLMTHLHFKNKGFRNAIALGH